MRLLLMSLILAGLTLPALASPDDDALALLHLAAAKQRALAARAELEVFTYEQGLRLARDTGTPVVVFVGVAPRTIPGCLLADAKILGDGTRSAIIISDGNSGTWLAPTATDAQIRAEAFPAKAVSPAAVPFLSSGSRAGQARAEGDGTASSLRYHAGHNCPSCGAQQTAVSGRGPNGTHTHRCGRCGTMWAH